MADAGKRGVDFFLEGKISMDLRADQTEGSYASSPVRCAELMTEI